jgi:hypothetical protein
MAVFPRLAAANLSGDNWVGGVDSNWNTAGNWSFDGGAGVVPQTDDEVTIAPSTTSSFTVNYNYNGAAVTLDSLTVDRPNTSGTNTLVMASDSLSAETVYVGYSGIGVVNQSGGTTNLLDDEEALELGANGGTTGTYILSGSGTLTADGDELVGFNGAGIFSQSGGMNSAAELVLGAQYNTTGSYTLSGGGTVSVETESIGANGGGVFNQSGGSNKATEEVDISAFSSTGQYILSGGTLTVTSGGVYVGGREEGGRGTGILTVSGGLLSSVALCVLCG